MSLTRAIMSKVLKCMSLLGNNKVLSATGDQPATAYFIYIFSSHFILVSCYGCFSFILNVIGRNNAKQSNFIIAHSNTIDWIHEDIYDTLDTDIRNVISLFIGTCRHTYGEHSKEQYNFIIAKLVFSY